MKMKIKNLKKELRNEKVKYDPAFQRRVLWTSKHFSYFLESVTKGWALMPFTLAEVVACLDTARESQNEISTSYFAEVLSRGYKFISIDGQNRTKKMIEFLENRFTVTGTFKDADGELHELENIFFKDMPQRLRDAINDADVNVIVYTDVTRADLSDIFRRINSGCPLNAHGLRQCTDTPIADWIRKESSQNQSMMAKVLTQDKRLEMLDDELLAKAAMTMMKNYRESSKPKDWDLKSQDIDSWYRMGESYLSLDDPTCPYLREEVDRISDIFRIAATIISLQKASSTRVGVPLKHFWAVMYVSEWAHDNQYFIQSPQALFAGLKDIDNTLISDSKNAEANHRKQAIENGQDPNTVSGSYYHNWISLPHQSTDRNKRKDALLGEVKKHLHSLTLRKCSMKKAA